MKPYRLLLFVFVLTCVPLACFAGSQDASSPGPSIRPTRWSHPNRSAVLSQTLRQQTLAKLLSGTYTAANDHDDGWRTRYNLYVGCSHRGSYAGPTGIAQALSVARPYTTIHVCPGQYAGGNLVTQPYIEVIGVSDHQWAETVSCGNVPNTIVDNLSAYGFQVNSSHVRIENFSVENCYLGVNVNYNSTVVGPVSPQVYDVTSSGSWFVTDTLGFFSWSCTRCRVLQNSFLNNGATNAGTAIETFTDTGDSILHNSIVGTFANYSGDGIYVGPDTLLLVSDNSAAGVYHGLVLDYDTQYSFFMDNHLDNNAFGIYIYNQAASQGSSANLFRNNEANRNSHDGFYVGTNSGVLSTIAPYPNFFISNQAYGNGLWDYQDATYPTPPGPHGNNADTANYYNANRGQTANPPSILSN